MIWCEVFWPGFGWWWIFPVIMMVFCFFMMRRCMGRMMEITLLPEAGRICHGGLLEAAGGMRDLVQKANRVLILDGCGMACATRLTKGAFPDLSPQVVFTDKLFEYDQNLFGVDEMPDVQISANAQKVAAQVVEKFF